MRFVVLVTVTAFSLTACAFHKQLPRPLAPAAVAQVQDALENRGAEIEYGYPGYPSLFAEVKQGDFRVVNPGRPSLVLLTYAPVAHAVPLEHVRSLRVNNHWLGALEGLGIGTLSGAVLGTLLAPENCEGDSDHCSGLDVHGMVLVSSMVLGAVLGAGIGAIAGQPYVYTF
jgi:hypothetical protein